MPTLPLKNNHKQRTFQRKDYYSSANRLFSSEKWKKMRMMQLSMHPLCEKCAHYGKTILAVHVDHVHPHKGNPHIFYNSSLQSLCHSCHSWKTVQEMKGKYYSWKNGEEQIFITNENPHHGKQVYPSGISGQ
jgi:5-methylcytosine-specific restriction endonuclease McrA